MTFIYVDWVSKARLHFVSFLCKLVAVSASVSSKVDVFSAFFASTVDVYQSPVKSK